MTIFSLEFLAQLSPREKGIQRYGTETHSTVFSPSDKNSLNLRYHIFKISDKTTLKEVCFSFKKQKKNLDNVNY